MIRVKPCIENWRSIMKSKQLFCLTYAGGTAGFYDDIEKDLFEYDVVKLEYSGHGTRHKEPYYKSFDELADDMYTMVKCAFSGGEYALFGYSMGSISLVEVLRRILADSRFPDPCYVFLAAHEPHTKAELADFSSGELDEYVKQRTIKFGAVPEVLLRNRTFWRMYLPLYRADYSLIGRYKFEHLDIKTTIPATVFYSPTDTPIGDMMKWHNYFVGECDYYSYEGTHFFIQEHHREMAEIIRKKFDGRIRNDI